MRNKHVSLRFKRAMRTSVIALCLSSMVVPSYANVVGSDAQNFNPTNDGIDFVTVHSGRTLKRGILVFGLFGDHAANVLPNLTNPQTGRKNEVQDQITSLETHFGLGLTDSWEVGLSLASVVNQSVQTEAFKAYFTSQGMTNVRLSTKYGFLNDRKRGLAFIASMDLPQVENNLFYGVGGGPVYNFELAASSLYKQWGFGANAGYRVRNPGTAVPGVPVAPVDDAYIGSGAISYRFKRTNWSAIGELYAGFPVNATSTHTQNELSQRELNLGFKYKGIPGFAVHGGIGRELGQGTFTPDWRVYLGFNWILGRMFGGDNKPRPPAPRYNVVKAPPIMDEDLTEVPESTPSPQDLQKMTVQESSAKDTSVFDLDPTSKQERFIVRDINFAVDSDVVPASFDPYLERLVEHLNKEPVFQRLTIYGHTDSQGSATYNQDLSQRRANAVKRALVERFEVPANRVRTVGMGLSSPIASNATEEGRSRNRRVEFEVQR